MASDRHMALAASASGEFFMRAAEGEGEADIIIDIVKRVAANAESEGMRRAAEIARGQAEYCRGRQESAEDVTKDNFWGGCCDTAGIIAGAILSQAGETS